MASNQSDRQSGGRETMGWVIGLVALVLVAIATYFVFSGRLPGV